MPCIEQIRIKGIEVDSELQPTILSIMKNNPHLVLGEVNSFIDEPLEDINGLTEQHYEEVAGRMYNYFTDESFINEFGDWLNDNTMSANKYSNGEPRLTFDKNLNKHYYRNKYDDKIFFPLQDNGLHYLYDEETIAQGTKYIAYKFFQSNFKQDYSDLSFISELDLTESVRQIIMGKINDYNGTDQEYLADELRESLYYLEDWTDRVRNHFDSLGFKIKEVDAEIQYEEENTTQELVRTSSFEKDSKNAVSSNIKAFLSFIPDTNKFDSVFEETGFVEFEDIYNTLQDGLSDISPTLVDSNVEDTYDIMLQRIGELAHRKPYLKELLNILNHPSLTQEKKSEFTQAFMLVKNPYFVTEVDFTGANINLTSKDVSQVNANFNVIKREWGYNFEANFLEDNKLDKPKLREVYDDLKVVRSDFDKLRRTITDAAQLEGVTNEVVNILRRLGIETTEKAFNAYVGNLADIVVDINTTIDKINNIIGTTDRFIKDIGNGKIKLYEDDRFANPFNTESLFKELAKEEAFYKPDGSDASIFSSGKSFWVYSLPSHIAGEVNKWKSNINELEDLYASTYGSDSKILQYLLAKDQRWVKENDRVEEATRRINNYKIGIFNALQNKKAEGIKSDPKGNTQLSETDAVIDSINRSLLAVKGENSLFNTPTPADKSTSYILSHGYFVRNNVNELEDGRVALPPSTIQIFYDYFTTEYDRMIKAASIIDDESSTKTVYYHSDKKGNVRKGGKVTGNAFKSQLFEGLSFDKIKTVLPEIAELIYNEDGTPALKALDDFEQPIKAYIKTMLQDGIDAKLGLFLNNDIIQYNPEIKGDFDARGIDNTILTKYKHTNNLPVHSAVTDFYINTLINNYEYSKIFSGDPAYYKNMIDYAKRIPATYTDGMQLRLLNNDELTFNAAIIANVEIGSKYMKELTDLVGTDVAEMYANGAINSTDAQAWITPKRWEFLVKRLGLWSKYHETAYPKMLGTDKPPFTEKELKAVAQPLKGVYFKLNNGIPTYLKYSQAVLLPGLIAGSDMQRMYDKMVKNNIDEVITLDGIKVGAPVPDVIHNDGGELLNDFELTPLQLDNRGWKLQQNLPTKTFKDTAVGSQIQKNVLAGVATRMNSDFSLNGKNIKGVELYRLINNIIGELSNRGVTDLTNELDIDTDGKINDIQSLYGLLLKEAKKRNINDNLIKALEKEISIYGIPQSHNKLMNMFFSIVKDRLVKIKTNGGSFIQVSNFGIDKLTDPQKTGVKWFIDPEKGLKPPHIVDGKVQPGQILLPGSMIAKQIPNWKELEPSVLKEMIDPEILKNIIGYRIPNQGLSSNDSLEIVGFMPEGVGDAVIAYSEIPTKTGSDFDIDKMYIMIPSFSQNEDGNLEYTKPKVDENGQESSLTEQPKAVLQNKLIEAYKAIFLHSEVIKDVMTPIDHEHLEKDIKAIRGDVSGKPDLYHFDAINQINLKYSFMAGKAGTGQYSNQLTSHARGLFVKNSLFGTNIGDGHLNDIGETLLDEEHSIELSDEDATYIVNKVNKFYNNDDSHVDWTVEGVRKYKIADSISAGVNGNVDIAKDPYITDGNYVTQTNSVIGLMFRSGMHPFRVNRFIGQPIIKEYIDFVTNAESKFKDEKGNMRDLFLVDYKNRFMGELSVTSGTYSDFVGTATLKQLDSEIKNPTPDKQYRLINKFFELQDLSKNLNEIINASKPDVSGAGKDLSSRFMIDNLVKELKANEANEVKGGIRNFSDLLIDPTTGEDTILSHYINNSVYWTDKILKNNPKIFLLANENVEKTFNVMSKQLRGNRLTNQAIADELYKSFYSYTMSGFEGLKADKPALNLFVNLPKDVATARQEDDHNFFLQQLELIEEDDITFIKLQNKKRSKNIQNKLYRGWKGLMEERPELARNLVKYSYYQSGFQNNINEFFSHIPHEYFVETKLNQYIYEVNSELNDTQYQFINQFYRHNHDNPLIVPNFVGKTIKPLQKGISYMKVNEDGTDLPPFAKVDSDLVELQGYTKDGHGVYTVTYKLGLSKNSGSVIEYKFNEFSERSQFGSNNPSNLAEINKYIKTLNLPIKPGELELMNNKVTPIKEELNESEKDFNSIFKPTVKDVITDKNQFIKKVANEFFPGYINANNLIEIRLALFSDDLFSRNNLSTEEDLIRIGIDSEHYAKDAEGLKMKGYTFEKDGDRLHAINSMLVNILKGRALQQVKDSNNIVNDINKPDLSNPQIDDALDRLNEDCK